MSPTQDTLLLLADGYTARGSHLGRSGTTVGKLVFNTSMTGYHEILTDPSYAGEIITFTFPLQGIYGVCPADAQSERIHARGVVVGERYERSDNWRSALTLNDLLLSMEIVGLTGIDTRRLTRHIRNKGEMLGIISSELSEVEAKAELLKHPDFGQQDLVPEVSCNEPYVTIPKDFDRARLGPLGEAATFAKPDGAELTVAAYDFGIKRGILECFGARGVTVHVFPCTAGADELLAVKPDGIFLSNGPGDPERMDYALQNVRALMDKLPDLRHLPRAPADGARGGHPDLPPQVRQPRREPSRARPGQRQGAHLQPEPQLRRRAGRQPVRPAGRRRGRARARAAGPRPPAGALPAPAQPGRLRDASQRQRWLQRGPRLAR